MSTLECTYEGFCKQLIEFRNVLKDPNLTREELDQAWKCLSLHYLGINYESTAERIFAVQRFQYVSREYMDRDIAFELNSERIDHAHH